MSGHALFANMDRILFVQVHQLFPLVAINAVHALTGVTPEIEQGEEWFLELCRFRKIFRKTVQDKIQLLLEGMIISLQTIEEQYGEHIKITFKK